MRILCLLALLVGASADDDCRACQAVAHNARKRVRENADRPARDKDAMILDVVISSACEPGRLAPYINSSLDTLQASCQKIIGSSDFLQKVKSGVLSQSERSVRKSLCKPYCDSFWDAEHIAAIQQRCAAADSQADAANGRTPSFPDLKLWKTNGEIIHVSGIKHWNWCRTEFQQMLVYFYDPTCKPCQALKRDWVVVSETFSKRLACLAVDCKEQIETCSLFNFTKMPTPFYFANSTASPHDFSNAETFQEVVDFVENTLQKKAKRKKKKKSA